MEKLPHDYGTNSAMLQNGPSSSASSRASAYGRWKSAIQGERFPTALIDLDAVDTNVATLTAPLANAKQSLRIATKSMRCPDLVRYVREKIGARARGLMTFTAAETEHWANEGERDLLLAYPVARKDDVDALARANAVGAVASVVVDCEAHLELIARAAAEHGVTVPAIVEVDLAYRPLGPFVHLGVRRSPIRDAAGVVRLARKIADTRGLSFHGVMGYEGQIAGVDDVRAIARVVKARSKIDVAKTRAEIATELERAGLAPKIFNGGGSGSLVSSTKEAALTEVSAGSGFLDSHLFDHYRHLDLVPAIAFALAVVRKPAPGMVTCHGGGFVASGTPGPERLPLPYLPAGLSYLSLEGAGEVQTPLAVPKGVALELGDPVFFRHAKAGELAEHFAEYLFVRGDRIERRAKTYRGLGHVFLG